jgi:DNA invertase Pin-like site-specific DNA recombinase
MKAVLYARISTKDQHSIPMQLEAMKQYAELRGWQVVDEIEEAESGKKNDRPGRDKIIRMARSGKIDVILVWKLNRWGRSTADLLMSLDDLQAHQVSFVSLSEQLDLTSPTGRMMAGILAVFAQFEREMIVENVKAGIAAYRAKNPGKWGRPPKLHAQKERALQLRAEGRTVEQICYELGISRASYYRLVP